MVRAANTSAQDSDDSQIRDRNTTSKLMSEFLSACWGNVRLHSQTKLGSTVNAATVVLFKDSSPAPRLYCEPFTSHLLLRQKGAGSQRQAPPGTLVYRPRRKSTLCFFKKKKKSSPVLHLCDHTLCGPRRETPDTTGLALLPVFWTRTVAQPNVPSKGGSLWGINAEKVEQDQCREGRTGAKGKVKINELCHEGKPVLH